MPETTPPRPRYLARQNARGDRYAYTRSKGRMISLGRYGTEKSHARFREIEEAWEADQAHRRHRPEAALTIAELAERYLDHEAARCESGEIHKKSLHAARYACEALIAEHAGVPVTRFGPRLLTTIQRRLLEKPCCTTSGRHTNEPEPPTLARSEVNRRVNGIRRLFRWAVREELIEERILNTLTTVDGLRTGQGRDSSPREAACPDAVRRTVDHLRGEGHVGFAGALELLRWTGCRPTEICHLRMADVAETAEGLELRIRDHKTRKTTGLARIVPLNPRASVLVRDAMTARLGLDLSRPLFTTVRGRPLTANGLFQAIRRTTQRLGIPRWTAYQLRHLAATEMLDAGHSETEVAAMLGHTPNSTVVRRYSRDRTRLARRAASGIGSREAG